MTVKRRKAGQTPRVLIHRGFDIRGGVSVSTAELGGDFLPEGAVVTKPENGICRVVKYAAVVADSTDSTVKVGRGHNFKAGDKVLPKEGAEALTVKSVAHGKDSDTLTLSAAPSVKKGGVLVEADKAGAGAVMKYKPFAVVGTGKAIAPGENVDTDAWVIGVTHGLPEAVVNELKGIVNY